jgi:hypothetical protein
MYQTIVNAMAALGDSGLVFGAENSQKGEDEFQLELGRKLQQLTESDGWNWSYWRRNEEKFETDALANEKLIKVDVVGRHQENRMVAIEMKYVITNPRQGGKPSDPPAFPYDVAKDCLRLDLLHAGKCKPLGEPIPGDLQTYAIAMTDWPDYWQPRKANKGWAANFYNAIRSETVRFENIIPTLGSDSNNTIALGRCHIAFGRAWTGEWKPYGTKERTDRFRYLLLRPDSDRTSQWTHHEQRSVEEQSAILPFLNRDSRDAWRKRNSKKKRLRNQASAEARQFETGEER